MVSVRNVRYDPLNVSRTSTQRRTTVLKCPNSDQPFPDRYFAWLEINNSGYWAANAGASVGFDVDANQLTTPFNPAVGSVMPNPLVAANVAQPAGLKNLVTNAGTGTGLYVNYRVWRAICTITVQPTSSGDPQIICIAPTTAGGIYGSITTASQGPNSVKGTATSSTGTSDNTVQCNISLPKVLGVPESVYAADINTAGSFSTGPVTSANFQFFAYNQNQVVNTNKLPYTVRVRYFVEFFNRTDSSLLDQ